MSQKPNTPRQILKGSLHAYSDQGSEGTHWLFIDENATGADAWHSLEKGDVLQVFNDKARKDVIFEGEINLDTEIGKRPNPHFPTWILQWVDRVGTVHGLQTGVEPDAWAKMFVDEKPAILIPAKPARKF